MISYGKQEWVPQMKALWHDVFGDSEEYLDSFFGEVYREENTLVYLEKETVVAILFMVPYAVNYKKAEQQCVYLYALATNPSYRGKKIMTQLVEKSIRISRERGYAFAVLVPASASLFEYYRQFGFQECAEFVTITKSRQEVDVIAGEVQVQEVSVNHSVQEKLQFMSADAAQIWRAYSRSHFYLANGIVLSQKQNQFYLDELEKEGGEAFVFNMNGQLDGYVLLKQDKSVLEILETNVDSKHLNVFYKTLLKKYTFQQLKFHQPICFSQKERMQNKKNFAMALDLQEKQVSNEDSLKRLLSVEHPPELFINRVLM